MQIKKGNVEFLGFLITGFYKLEPLIQATH